MAPVVRHEPLRTFDTNTDAAKSDGKSFSRGTRNTRMHEAPQHGGAENPAFELSAQRGELIACLAEGRINAVESAKMARKNASPRQPASPYEALPGKTKKMAAYHHNDEQANGADRGAGVRSGTFDRGRRAYSQAAARDDKVVIGPKDEQKVQLQDSKEPFYNAFSKDAAGVAAGAFSREKKETKGRAANKVAYETNLRSHTTEVHSHEATDQKQYSSRSTKSNSGDTRGHPTAVTSPMVNRKNLERYGDLEKADHAGVASGTSHASMVRSRSSAAAGISSNRCAFNAGYAPIHTGENRRLKGLSPFSPVSSGGRSGGGGYSDAGREGADRVAGARSGWGDDKVRCLRQGKERPTHGGSIDHCVFNKEVDAKAVRQWEQAQQAQLKDYAGHGGVRCEEEC